MRDTDADWVAIAEHEPYFGVLANPEYLSGSIDDDALDRFYASGRSDIAHAAATIRSHLDPAFAPELGVDFGCGVGRLSIAMREHCQRVIGVDVAPQMRAIATQAAIDRGLTDLTFVSEPPLEGVGWVNSLIVLQHIPPVRGYELIRQLSSAVIAGGIISLQLTTHRDSRHLHEIFRDVEIATFDGQRMNVFSRSSSDAVGQMSMFDYDLGAVMAMLTGLGYRSFWLEHTDHGGMHGYWIFARRTAAGAAVP